LLPGAEQATTGRERPRPRRAFLTFLMRLSFTFIDIVVSFRNFEFRVCYLGGNFVKSRSSFRCANRLARCASLPAWVHLFQIVTRQSAFGNFLG
jgi:hypothetical protein